MIFILLALFGFTLGISTIETETLNNQFGVKVYRPTGPQTIALECNEYGYIRYRINHPEVLSNAAYFDLDFMQRETEDVLIQKVIEKAPMQSFGYIAFFPWNEPNLSSEAEYVIGMSFYDENENELAFHFLENVQNAPPFKTVFSVSFKIPQCSGITGMLNE